VLPLLEDLIRWSPAEVQDLKSRNLALDSVIEEILFPLCSLDPDVTTFRLDPLDGIGIFNLAINLQTLNKNRAVTW